MSFQKLAFLVIPANFFVLVWVSFMVEDLSAVLYGKMRKKE